MMFQIRQGELARSAGISPAMLSLTLAGKKRPSARLAVATIHGLEKLLTQGRRLDTTYFGNTGIPRSVADFSVVGRRQSHASSIRETGHQYF